MIRNRGLAVVPGDADEGDAPRLCADLSAAAPVFLHTGWRTRGTWLWSRFRALHGTSCFYEPLSEDLATLSPAAIDASSPTCWASGHPPLHRPYFAEFRPLLKIVARGVRSVRSDVCRHRLLRHTGQRHAWAARLSRIAAARGAG